MSLPQEWPTMTEVERHAYFAESAREYRASQAIPGAATALAVRLDGGWAERKPSIAAWADEPRSIEAALPPVASFEADMLPSVLSDYVLDVAERQQSPADFVAVSALCGLASLAGNRVRIRPKTLDDWEVAPNLWGALIGRPSAMKTPTQAAALAPVYELQSDMRTAWERECRDDEVEAAIAALSVKDAKKKAAKALEDGDRAAARDHLAAQSAQEQEIPCPRLIVADSTFEKLGELLSQNTRGLLLVRDELPGLLSRLEKTEFQSERAFYLEAYNGLSPYVFDRIGRGTIHVPHTTLSLIGGIQPSRIAPLVRGALNGSGDDGLLQRLQLAVWPDDRVDWKWIDRSPSETARDAYRQAFRRVDDMTRQRESPAVYGFDSHGQALFRKWYEAIQVEARSGDLSPALEAHVLKLPKTVASLSLIFHLVDGGDGPVTAEATGRSLDWADYLRTHAARLYASGAVASEDGARLIIKRRSSLPSPFTARDVQRKNWGGLSEHADVADAVDLLEMTGHVRRIAQPTSPGGGRPATSYEWHPSLKAGG